ncbi:MAG: tRNA (guanosine(37)-N1)-methyltransferase TrmD [Bacteroidetes bacterium]|nr:tRNA (guanosine(37)-N1)-methyltransferase TrmD [Bacteroidota bacterium]
MQIDIITSQPDLFTSVLNNSIIGRAIANKFVKVNIHNLHNWAKDKFKHIDDTQYGGGSGMVIKCEPVFDCINELKTTNNYDEIIYMAPDAPKLTQSDANRLSLHSNIIILCGHYKGIDQRIRDELITAEISIGDYVLTGGELPAMVLLDAVIRLIPGVLSDIESALTDSFMDGLLEAPIYTKPAVYKGLNVPDVLLSGNHQHIKEWRQNQSYNKTKLIRPDLLDSE